MERLKLNVPTLISQKVHHHLQVRLTPYVFGHDIVVCPIEKDLAQELERLALCDIVGGKDEGCVHREELCEVFEAEGKANWCNTCMRRGVCKK
jgi:hypothetical protein